MAALTVGAIFLGRAFSPELETRPRVAFYWGWGVGLFVLVGLCGLLPARGAFGDFARITSGLSLLCEAFLVLGFFSEWFARWSARAQPAATGGLEAGGSRA